MTHSVKLAEQGLYKAAVILDIQEDNYRTKTFVLDASISAQPGQFIMLWLPGFDEKPFSLVSNDPVTLMIASVGPFTRLIHESQPGDRMWFRGPFGNGFSPQGSQQHALLVGGGYGVAPLLWLARDMSDTSHRLTVAIGAQTQKELLYADRFQALTSPIQESRFSLLLATEDGTEGHTGLVTEFAELVLNQENVDHIYACGPHGMLEAVKKLAQGCNISCQLSWEAYMRCGMGLCGACEHEQKLLCIDGPVLCYRP